MAQLGLTPKGDHHDLLLGIDTSTTATKALLVRAGGEVLHPIHRMTQTAQAIYQSRGTFHSGSLSSQPAISSAGSKVSSLSSTPSTRSRRSERVLP